jgi:K+-transporting ATPase ATPase A chain
MTTQGWIQLLLFIGVLVALTKPLGAYLVQVLDPDRAGRRPFLEPILRPVERLIYAILGVRPEREQTWKGYSIAMLVFTLVTTVLTYAILRLQDHIGLNPQALPAVPDAVAFNTAVSFATNTNWQSYTPESTMSYFSQMVALVSHNFFSAATGIAVAAAVVRGIARDRAETLGNFWVDLVRIHLYILLPISILYATFLVSQGMIQNFLPYTQLTAIDQSGAASTTQPVIQSVAQGPAASQVAIKMLGTNGGGFFNANAAHPFENPTPLSNFVQMVSIFAIPSALTWYLGKMVRKQGHGWAVWAAMFSMFIVGALVCWHYEAAGNPRLAALGIDQSITATQSGGNMEGKEVRFGTASSALFATITTDTSCGAVNSMHDSFTPIGGLVPLFNLHLGEVVFGGVGSGLYCMVIFIVLAIFIAGLMVGRTPEYLGKKIEAYDVKCSVIALVAPSIPILLFTAWACVTAWGTAGTNNSGPHGFSEILYAFSSAAANNGSAFAGLTATPTPPDAHYNVTLTITMFIGRFFMIIPLIALAGNIGRKKLVAVSSGSFPVTGFTFTVLLIGTVVIVGALTFLPSLALGPIVEHFITQDLAKSITY